MCVLIHDTRGTIRWGYYTTGFSWIHSSLSSPLFPQTFVHSDLAEVEHVSLGQTISAGCNFKVCLLSGWCEKEQRNLKQHVKICPFIITFTLLLPSQGYFV